MTVTLQLLDANQKVVKERSGQTETYLDYHSQYTFGDAYQVICDQAPCHLVVQLDPSLQPALIYVAGAHWRYQVPFNLQREWPYPDGAFLGKNHYATVRLATDAEIQADRNVAQNSHDQHDDSGAYPHASANAETRDETVFYAKNAIDGLVANESHGNYPYQSWGIDQQDDAELTLEFGRPVVLNRVGIVLRADYPHDSYWTAMTIVFSDGSQEVLAPQKVSEMQTFSFPERTVTSLKLTNLQKDQDSSTFPALTEIACFGHDILD